MFAPTSAMRRRRWRVTIVAIPLTALVAVTMSPSLTSATGTVAAEPQQQGDRNTSERVENVVFAIHGGAGTIRREDMTPELEQTYRDALTHAVRTGYQVIREGGTSTDAVEAAIVTMEDSPLFNAGKGAVFTTDAGHELDASVMDGETLDAGAVTGVQHIKNPISLARELMDRSRHVLLAGDGAELFAQHRDFDLVTQDYFFTQRRWDALLAAKGGRTDFAFGETNTVGAVGLDQQGNLAAGTSTGGLTNKPVGRVGDSPIIGAGTYADNDTAAASATGTGELFMRQAVTHEISALMEYTNRHVDQAAGVAIDKTEEIGGADTGGVIALDPNKSLAFVFNTRGMYRGYATADGRIVVKIFHDD
jgi:beta-aspartyl-peptidase (threonine type)